MVNTKLVRELEKKNKGHILFDYQKPSDLWELKKILEERGEIVVDFSVMEWNEAFKVVLIDQVDGKETSREKTSKLNAARQYAATKLLAELEKKYPQVKEYGGSDFLPIFTEGDREKYEKKQETIYNLKDVEDILEVEGIKVDRVHFLMNGTRSDALCDALSMLLSDDTPFRVSIYSSPNGFYTCRVPDAKERIWIHQAYNYTRFSKYEEGVVNKAARQYQKRKNEKQG